MTTAFPRASIPIQMGDDFVIDVIPLSLQYSSTLGSCALARVSSDSVSIVIPLLLIALLLCSVFVWFAISSVGCLLSVLLAVVTLVLF